MTIADAQLAKPSLVSASDQESENEKRKCKECLLTGVGNWEVMLQRLADQEQPVTKSSSWKFWQKSSAGEDDKKSSFEEDQKTVERLRERIIRDGLRDQVIRAGSQTGIWFG